MSEKTDKLQSHGSQPPGCVARSVLDLLSREPAVEAVTIDRSRQTVSVATLGTPRDPRLPERVASQVQRAENTPTAQRCGMFTGQTTCLTCGAPLTTLEQERIHVQRQGTVTTISRVTCPTAPKFWRWRAFPLPRLVQRDAEFLEHAEELDEWKYQLAAAVACGVFGLLGYALGEGAWALACYLAAYAAGGWYALHEVWERLRHRAIDVHFLMLAVAVGSASIGAWGEGAMLLFLFSLSGALEHFAMSRTQREIRALFHQAPKVATVIEPDGKEHEAPVESLRPGMRLMVKPGAQFPVDAEIVKGHTAADESNLTGEAIPVEKTVGDLVFGGTLNLWGAVEATVLRPASESALQKIIHLIRQAQHQKAPAQRFTDRFSSVYTYAVMGLTLVMFLVWWLGFSWPALSDDGPQRSAFYHAMTLLVVSSPCALVLSIPSAVLAAIAWGARRGILFRGGAAVENLAEVRVAALDKTGTLTTGELEVERIESLPPGRESEVARIAYSLERLSAHPLARAVTRYGKQHGLEALELEGFESLTGQGLQARRNGVVYRLGRREFVEPHAPLLRSQPRTEDPGLAEVWVCGDDLLGRIVLRDAIRPESREVVQALRESGVYTVVLTGDRMGPAQYLQRELGLDEVRAELKPEQKVAAIQELKAAGRRVAMIGDGVNDAPSLAAADVGVAMGARGADAALEQADVVLMHDRLENFLAALRLSQRARSVIRQNLMVSLGTVAVLVTFALLGRIPLTLGVVGHEGSTVLVVMNSLRLLFVEFFGRRPARVAAPPNANPQPGGAR